MSSLSKSLFFSLLLIALGLGSIGVRTLMSNPESIPTGDSLWKLEWSFVFQSSAANQEIKIATPLDTKYVQVVEQNVALQGAKLGNALASKSENREVVAIVNKEQAVYINLQYVLHLSPVGIPNYLSHNDRLNAHKRQLYTKETEFLPIHDERVHDLLAAMNSDSTDSQAVFNVLFKYCTQKIPTDEYVGMDDVRDVLDDQHASVLGKVRLLTTLARASKIPARIVTGLILDEENSAKLHYWMEVNIDDTWLAYDPSEGYVFEVPSNYVPIKKNGDAVLTMADNVELTETFVHATKKDPSFDFSDMDASAFSQILDLNRLSLNTRLMLAFLLLLPLGALLTFFIKQVLGANVFGTFTPTFLALALTQAGWITGGIILFAVTVFGIIGRALTPLLGINKTSRLSLVFILVAISMIFSVSFLMYLGIALDSQVVLLPIVILTFMIDRIYGVADSLGVKVASIRLAWTLGVSVIVALILQMELLGLWLLSYPEAHLITAALVVLISLYSGEKWLRKVGLGWMLEPVVAKKKKKAKD